MRNPKDYYLARISELGHTVGSLKEKGDRIGWLRLLLAVIIAASIYPAVSISLHFLWLSLVMLIGFFRLVQLHSQNSAESELLKAIARLCSDEIKLIQGDHHVFDDGPAAVYRDHIYAFDLDIFGTTSLFKEINRTVTFEGRRLIIDALLNPLKETQLIEKRKQAIADMTGRVSWRQQFFAVGSRSGETVTDMSDVNVWLNLPKFFEGRKHWLWIASISSLVSVSAISWMILTSTFFLGLLVGILVLNSAIFQFIARDSKLYFSQFGSRTVLFRKFASMFELVGHEQFTSELATELRESVTHASAAFLKLAQLYNLAEQRANNLVSFTMNGLFLFDLWTIYRIENWRINYSADTISWLKTLGQIDMLASCANFRFNHPTFVNAEIVATETPFIKAKGLAHPLIKVEDAVVNDYEIGVTTRAHVVTGSNMAGKSTFIRAVGLNVVLALNGLPVFATGFSCSAMRIASCIRITDSLEDHASYFKAELDRLSTILTILRSGEPYLVLLDEILRGTNSDDKHEGTLAFYRKLSSFNCISLLATHDLSIGKLQQELPDRFANYCFESTVDGSELKFDYKLRPGTSRSTNATFLMRKLNLID